MINLNSRNLPIKRLIIEKDSDYYNKYFVDNINKTLIDKDRNVHNGSLLREVRG